MSITAKLLFVSRRARPDIQVAISFLTSRVTKADRDDWKKLKRVLQYLNWTIDMPLTLSIDNLCVVKTWVDAAFATHDDMMRSHTGGIISMGKGALYASSRRQKINTKSSTEAELVGAADFLAQTLWTTNFLRAQGYEVSRSEYHQDNQSAMKMEKNGRQSAGQKSRHINIRYFFIKDRVASGEITLLYCPTGEMLGDFFSKPQQGGMFRRFRDVIMGVTHHSSIRNLGQPQDQERVGEKDLVGKSQPELTILAPTRKEKNKCVTNERTSAKWANVTWAKILGNSQEQGTRDIMQHRADQQVGRT
eukprot:scaffold800_cov138-Cylindrotheca_fusiformis.AAC.2